MPFSQELIKQARLNLQGLLKKNAFVEMDANGIKQAQDPAQMGGGAPPMQGGAPPMDPSQAGGAPPMDPSQMGGGAPPPQGGQDPNQPVMLSLNDLMQFVSMMSGGGAGAAAQPAPAPAEAPNEGPKSKGEKGKALDGKVDQVLSLLQQLIAIMTGKIDTGEGAGGGGGADQLGLGQAPPSMGAPMDAGAAPPAPMMPGQPAGAPPGVGGPGMQVQASDKRADRLLAIVKNLRRS